MDKKFIRLPKVKEKTGLPKSTIYRKVKEKSFPPQVSLGEKTVAWVESDIDKWMDERIREATNDNYSLLHEEIETL